MAGDLLEEEVWEVMYSSDRNDHHSRLRIKDTYTGANIEPHLHRHHLDTFCNTSSRSTSSCNTGGIRQSSRRSNSFPGCEQRNDHAVMMGVDDEVGHVAMRSLEERHKMCVDGCALERQIRCRVRSCSGPAETSAADGSGRGMQPTIGRIQYLRHNHRQQRHDQSEHDKHEQQRQQHHHHHCHRQHHEHEDQHVRGGHERLMPSSAPMDVPQARNSSKGRIWMRRRRRSCDHAAAAAEVGADGSLMSSSSSAAAAAAGSDMIGIGNAQELEDEEEEEVEEEQGVASAVVRLDHTMLHEASSRAQLQQLVTVGSGRTLRGRHLRDLRYTVWKHTGFL